MKSPLPVVFRKNQQDLLANSVADAVKMLSHILRDTAFDFFVNPDQATSFRVFGTPVACVLIQDQQNLPQTFSLSKRQQTPQAVTAVGRTEMHPHHRILQRDDVQLILTCIFQGEPVPDAYHLEPLR